MWNFFPQNFVKPEWITEMFFRSLNLAKQMLIFVEWNQLVCNKADGYSKMSVFKKENISWFTMRYLTIIMQQGFD